MFRRSAQFAQQGFTRFVGDESGGTIIEYGMIVAFIAFAIIGFVTSMGNSVNSAFTDINSDLGSVLDNL